MTDGEHRDRAPGGMLTTLFLGWEICKSLVSALTSGFRDSGASRNGSVSGHEERTRAEDENTDPKRETASHQRWGTLFVFCAFIVAIGGGVAFLYVYWTSTDNIMLGGSLALFFGGLGLASVLYSHWLMPRIRAIEPREQLPSSTAEREAFAKSFYAGENDVHRRGLLKWIIAAAGLFVVSIVVSMMRAFGKPPWPALFAPTWQRGERLMTMDRKPISVDTLQPGTSVVVFPESSLDDDQAQERSQTALVRVDAHLLDLPGQRAAWAPMGYVAYSRVCTHAGCPVGMFETTTDQLMCPCHQSTFDVLRAARPTGGPAARPLPQLPLYVDQDGTLRAGGDFSEPPGPGFWGMPA